jgi:hypothetical protein
MTERIAALPPQSGRCSFRWMDALAILLLGIATATIFSQMLFTPNEILVGTHDNGQNDVTRYYIASHAFARTAVSEFGELPFWNPYRLTGTPHWGNPQSGVLYPPNWLFYLFHPLGVISWVLLLHHWSAGIGAYFLAQRLQLRWGASVFGGCVYLGAPFLIAQTAEGHYGQICLVAWYPWVFFLYERFRHGERWSIPGLIIAFSMCFFCGHVQELLYLAIVLIAFGIADLVRGSMCVGSVTRMHLARNAAIVGIGTAGLVAVEVLPVGVYTTQAIRAAGLSIAQSSEISLGVLSLKQMMNPYALGMPDGYSGPGMYYWETLCHFGCIATLAAMIGAVARWRCSHMRRLSVIALLSFLFAFGDDTPVFSLMHQYCPGISFFRVPSRSLFLTSFAVSILAAGCVDWIVHRLTQKGPPKKRQKCVARTVPALAIIICCAESATLSRALLTTTESPTSPDKARILRHLEAETENGRIVASLDCVSDLEAIESGIRKFQGYDPVPLSRYAVFLSAMLNARDVGREAIGTVDIPLPRINRALADLAGIRLAVFPKDQPELPENWHQVDEDRNLPASFLAGGAHASRGLSLYRNQTPMPRAFVVGRVQLVESSETLSTQLRKTRFAECVLLQHDVLGDTPRQKGFRSATILSETPNSVCVEAQLDGAGYLVLSDASFPGWRAQVDGNPVPVLHANVLFRAVPLAPGKHEVVFEFTPPLMMFGMAISSLTAILILFFSMRQRETMADAPNS